MWTLGRTAKFRRHCLIFVQRFQKKWRKLILPQQIYFIHATNQNRNAFFFESTKSCTSNVSVGHAFYFFSSETVYVQLFAPYTDHSSFHSVFRLLISFSFQVKFWLRCRHHWWRDHWLIHSTWTPPSSQNRYQKERWEGENKRWRGTEVKSHFLLSLSFASVLAGAKPTSKHSALRVVVLEKESSLGELVWALNTPTHPDTPTSTTYTNPTSTHTITYPHTKAQPHPLTPTTPTRSSHIHTIHVHICQLKS